MDEKRILSLIMRGIGAVLGGMGFANWFEALFTAMGLHSSHYYSAADRGAAGASYLLAGLTLACSANFIARLFCRK